jgi:hypothetical protein
MNRTMFVVGIVIMVASALLFALIRHKRIEGFNHCVINNWGIFSSCFQIPKTESMISFS